MRLLRSRRILACGALVVIVTVALVVRANLLPTHSAQGQATNLPSEVATRGPSGQAGPIQILHPPVVANPASPSTYGSFRIVPYGSTVARDPSTSAIQPLVDTEDINKLRAARGFIEPSGLPARYSFISATGQFAGNLLQSYELTYSLPEGYPITVSRARFTGSFDVDAPAPAPYSSTELVQSAIGQIPAMIEQPLAGVRIDPARVTFAQDGWVTTVDGTVRDGGLSVGNLTQIAQSMTDWVISVGSPTLVNGNVQIAVNVAGTGLAPYAGFNIHLRWDHSLFNFASANTTGTVLPGSLLCPSAIPDTDGAGVLYACSTLGGAQTSSAGLLGAIVLTPVGTGCSLLHLFTEGRADGGDTSTGTYTIDANANVALTSTADGSSNQAGQTCL